MSWAERLAEIRAGKGPSGELTKLPKPHFVSFGSEQDGRFYPESAPKAPDPAAVHLPAHKPELLTELPDATAPDLAPLRANLLAICRSHGLPERLAIELPGADLAGCDELTAEGLLHFLRCRLERESMQRGIAPAGWTQASYCIRCGPVKLWPGAPVSDLIGCPWCHVRRSGGTLPRPAVTCATCTHQQRRKDTSDAAMHACGKGHGLHHAHALHRCTDWQPASGKPSTRQE
jgi:hypothetical protein